MRRFFRWALRFWLVGWLAFVALTLVVVHRAWARTERVLEDFGQHLMRYADANHQSEPSELLLNGASFFFSTGNADQSVTEVLDHFHTVCRKHGPKVRQMWRASKLPASLARGAEGQPWDGVVRLETERRGVVACLDTGGEGLSSHALLERIQRFLDTGDVSSVGDIRYAMVQRSEGERTAFVTSWTDGPVNVHEMFPKEGDAPGSDLPGLARPDGARRVLSGFHRGGEDLLALYTAPKSVDELHDFYLEMLRERGFAIHAGADTGGRGFIIAGQGNVTVSVGLFEADGQGMAIASHQRGNELVSRPEPVP